MCKISDSANSLMYYYAHESTIEEGIKEAMQFFTSLELVDVLYEIESGPLSDKGREIVQKLWTYYIKQRNRELTETRIQERHRKRLQLLKEESTDDDK